MKLTIGLMCLFMCGVAYSSTTTPLCTPCKCNIQQQLFIVDCSNSGMGVVKSIYDQLSYTNATVNGSLYEIDYLNLTSIPFLHLHEILPNSSVRYLDLSNGDITNIVDGAFQNLQSMIELKLGDNRLESLTPDTFKGIRSDGSDYPLRSLKTLYLNNNKLHTIHNDAFQHIEKTLEELYLNGNPLEVIDLQTTQAITGIVNLKVLDLSNTQIATLPAHFLHTPGNLQELYLANNKITNFMSLGLEMVHVLNKLVLNGNDIVNITETTGFPNVPSLKVLHLCNMPHLELVGNHSMCALSGLEELHMSDNPKLHTIGTNTLIRVEAGSEVPVIQKLKKLYLSNNMLAHLNLQLDWQTLKDFDISDNPWTCECENQWMVETLIPIYCNVNSAQCKALRCAAPTEMEGEHFFELHERKYEMRCLNYYNTHPEMDGVILVCFLLGLLIGIVVILFITYAYKRHWFGLFDNSPGAFSRQFYGRTNTNEEFYS